MLTDARPAAPASAAASTASAGGAVPEAPAPPPAKMPPPRHAPTLLGRVRNLAAHALPRALLAYRGAGAARRVALTFDDGPHEMTEAYLDVLERFGARATFFVVGKYCEGRDEILRRVVARGHELAGHGFTHRHFPKLGVLDLQSELRRTDDRLPAAPGAPPAPRGPLGIGRHMVRPPYGSTSVRSLAVCAAAGYTTVMWSRDSDDCRTTAPADVVARVAPSDLTPGEIVLLHEGQHWTLAALPPILEALAAAGWRAVTVSEILTPPSNR